ncbi:MAG TPA: TrmH family RNA methyltransferase [Candidatus Polarisedimenticolaceae bacterium]|nr:TrmH family RNA methyltransferase [Candidatus Polarisedimenticolaceae bacterium]
MDSLPSRHWRSVLSDVERAATRSGRSGVGCFVIEGTRLHERALRASAPPREVLVADSYGRTDDLRASRLLAALEACGCDVFRVPDTVIAACTAGREIGAIIGLVPLPREASLAAVLRAAPERPAVALVAVDVEDPGNVGALIRTALAGGADLFAAVGTTEPFHPKAVRTSMGSLFRLPLATYPTFDAFSDALREIGGCSYGATTRGGEALPRTVFGPEPVALVIGSEAFGLDPTAEAHVDRRVTIPMRPRVDSYSVNAAAAVLLYEVRRPPRRALRRRLAVPYDDRYGTRSGQKDTTMDAREGAKKATDHASERWLVSGRVQGVGFRYHVLRAARNLGVRGDVRNLPDGRVELRVRAPRELLSDLLRAVREGPPAARVESVERVSLPGEARFDGFSIR